MPHLAVQIEDGGGGHAEAAGLAPKVAALPANCRVPAVIVVPPL